MGLSHTMQEQVEAKGIGSSSAHSTQFSSELCDATQPHHSPRHMGSPILSCPTTQVVTAASCSAQAAVGGSMGEGDTCPLSLWQGCKWVSHLLHQLFSW